MSGDSEFNPVPTDDQAEIKRILSTVNNTTFEIGDWNIVIKECRSLAAYWEQLSGYIGLSCDLIDSIKGNYPINITDRWNEALKHWIKQNYETEKFGRPSWWTLLKGVSLVDKQLFKKLAADHQENTITSENNKGSMAEDKRASSSSLKGVMVKPCYTFPLLDLKKMDKGEKERLHQKLYAESENMEYKFQELFKATRISLVERMITIGELLKHLDCLGSVKPLYEGSKLPVFGRQLPRLRKTENVDNAMSVISSYCSFFNYRIVECIIENLGTDRDKINFKMYKEEFNIYAQRHIFMCPSEVGKIDEDSHANLFVTLLLDTSYDGYTVSHLYAFVNNLHRVLRIPPISLRLCHIGPGSLKLIFQLPHSLQRISFPLSSDQEADLASLGVTLLSCGSYLFNGQETEEDFDSDSDSDYIDSERTLPSMDSRDDELVSMVAGVAVGKSNDAPSLPDSALGKSSVLSGTTAGITQDVTPDEDLEDFTVEMRDSNEESDPKGLKLHITSRNGDLQETIRLVEKEHFNPLQPDKDGWNAIHFAAACGHLDILRYFIEERGCNAVCSDEEGWTPLHYAARFEHLHIVQYLIENQVEPLTRNKHGHTALHQACAGGSTDVINYLAKEMSKYLPLKDVVHDRDNDGFIPMHWATLFGRLDAIIFLITKLNCDPNTTDDKNRTFVHDCAQEGHLDVVRYFVEQQHCDPSCLTVNKVTPLHMAATKGHMETVKYLTLEQHCDPQWTSKNNNTPLHLAAYSGHLHVVKFLIETLHCPPDIRGQHNMTPLEQARSQGHHQVVEYLESISA